jgi:hypothetical protein
MTSFIKKIAKENYNKFHEKYPNKEAHHIFLRSTTIRRCCMRFLYPALPGPQDDIKFVEDLREKYREDLLKAESNYVKYIGCKENIFKDCYICAMPRIGGKDGNNNSNDNENK